MVFRFLALLFFASVAGAAPTEEARPCYPAFLEGATVAGHEANGRRHRTQRLLLGYDPLGWHREELVLESVSASAGMVVHTAQRMRSQIQFDNPFPTLEEAVRRALGHHERLSEAVVGYAGSAYGRRREEDWGRDFIALLAQLAPSYRNDAILVAVTDEWGHTMGTLRLVHAPYTRQGGEIVARGDLIRSFGYRSGDGFRPPALVWEANRPAVLPDVAETRYPPRPPRWLPGEEILRIEMPRDADTGVLWELTSFTIDQSLPVEVRDRVWIELWLQATRVLFSRTPEFNYHRQEIFTYGTQASIRLYDSIGIEPARRYRREGQLVEVPAGTRPPPIPLGPKLWWPLVFPLVKMEHLSVLLSQQARPRFQRVDATERRRELSRWGGMGGDHLWDSGPFLRELGDGTVLDRGGTVAREAGDSLRRMFQLAMIHEEARRHASPEVRERAEWAWSQAQPLLRGATRGLLEALATGDRIAREQAAETLGDRRVWAKAACEADGVTVRDALLAATADPEPAVRIAALRALVHYGDQLGPQMAKLAVPLGDGNIEVREAAGRAVAQMLSQGAHPAGELLPALTRALEDPRPAISCGAAWSLRAFGPAARSLAPRLAALFAAAPERDLAWRDAWIYTQFPSLVDFRRFALASAYHRVSPPGAEARRLLRETLLRGHYRFRMFAANELAEEASEASLTLLLEVLEGPLPDGSDWGNGTALRERILANFGQLGAKAASIVPTLQRLAAQWKETDANLAYRASSALWRLGRESVP